MRLDLELCHYDLLRSDKTFCHFAKFSFSFIVNIIELRHLHKLYFYNVLLLDLKLCN